MQAGFYTNETELVHSAVRRLREEKERVARFKTAVEKGVQEVKQGKTTPYTPDLMEEIVQTAIQKAENNEPYHSANAIPKNPKS